MLYSSSNQETRKGKEAKHRASPEKAHLSADYTSPLNFSISRIHFCKAFHFSPFCQQLQLQPGGRHAHIETMAFPLMSGRPLFPASAEYRLLRAWELALLMSRQGQQGPETPQMTDLPPSGARREDKSVTGTWNFTSPCPQAPTFSSAQ